MRQIHKSALTALLCLLAGLVIGVIIQDIPGIKFKNEVDLGSLISLFGLISAVYIIPFLINSNFAKKDNTNKVILADMDSCIHKLEEVTHVYKKLFLDQNPLNVRDRRELTSSLREVTNRLDSLSKELDKFKALCEFKTMVFAHYNESTYKDITENIIEGRSIDDQTYLKASKSLEETIARIKRYRYTLYSDN